MKTCTDCHVCKKLDCFSPQKKGKFGVTSRCKPCVSERGKKWHKENPEKARISKAEYNKNNKEKVRLVSKEWRQENSERAKQTGSIWAKKNSDKKVAASARRRAKKLQATPAWADHEWIERFYKLAREMTAKYGVKFTVDHTVPLDSPIVCGLHWEGNLTILTDKHNKSKGNHWWPFMPGRDEELDVGW